MFLDAVHKGGGGAAVQPLIGGAPAVQPCPVPGGNGLDIGRSQRLHGLIRRGLGAGEIQLHAAGADRGQKLAGIGGAQQEQGAQGRFLQQLQRGVLGGNIHGLRLPDDVHLSFCLIGHDTGIGGKLTDLVHADLPLGPALIVLQAGNGDHIRVNILRHLMAGAALVAGLFPPAGADRGGGQFPGLGKRRLHIRGRDEISVREAARVCDLQFSHWDTSAHNILHHIILPFSSQLVNHISLYGLIYKFSLYLKSRG